MLCTQGTVTEVEQYLLSKNKTDDFKDGTFTADSFVLDFIDDSTQTLILEATNWWGWPNLNLGVIQTWVYSS